MTPAEAVLAVGLLLALGGGAYLYNRLNQLERTLRRRPAPTAAGTDPTLLRHLGLVRYQAYHDVGGDHSFALALLDGQGTGVVLNSLYHRDRCRIYAKPVREWRSAITLTEEEEKAIERARTGEDLDELTPLA